MEVYTKADLKRAREICDYAHDGQTRFDDSPYALHPRRVSRIVKIQGHSICTQIVAVLHDTVEDNEEITFDYLRNEGFDDGVIVPLELLTKTKYPNLTEKDREAAYFEYILDIATNDRSRAVKKADLFDNLNLTGHNNPSRRQINNIKKYEKALGILARFAQPIV